MRSCKSALFVLFFVATSLFPTPAYSASWELLGTTASTSGNTYPGSRSGAANWVSNGTIWMFSGMGKEATSAEGYLTSLYTFNVSTAKWSLAAGSTTTNQAGVYPTAVAGKGSPGGRIGASQWTDSAGNLWLFGGSGIGNSSTVTGALNDLWKYTPSSAQWNYYGGSQIAGSATTDSTRPTPRQGAACWTDSNGNMWLFGGQGFALNSTKAGLLTDMWYYSPTQSTWTPYTSTSTPNARYKAASWTDASGNGWLYGGIDGDGNYLSDLWQFKTSGLTWLLKSGTPNVNQNPTYPTLVGGSGQPGGLNGADALSYNGAIYLFGGFGLGSTGVAGYNRDLWKFNVTSLAWSYVMGTAGVTVGSTTTPGARSAAAAWSVVGYFYIFGGTGYDTNGNTTAGDLGDNWRIAACSFDGSCTATVSTASTSTAAAAQTSGSTSGTGFASTSASTNTTGSTATTGDGGVQTTTQAVVTVTVSMTGDPSAINTNTIGGDVATNLGVPADYITITVVYDNGTVFTGNQKRAVNVPFHLVIVVTYPNSSAIAAATGTSPSANLTGALDTLKAAVTNAANSTAVRNTLSSSGVTVTGITATTTSSQVQTSSTTLPNFPYTTKSGYSAAFALTPSTFASTLFVLACSALGLALL